MSAAVWPWRQANGARTAAAAEVAQAARRARRGAALRTLVGLVIAALLLLWKPWLAAVAASLAVLTLALALASPLDLYARFEHGLSRFARGVGVAVTWILMPLLYVLLFLPVGLFLRATGKLRLNRGPDAAAATYWQPPQGREAGRSKGHWQGGGLDRYRRQF